LCSGTSFGFLGIPFGNLQESGVEIVAEGEGLTAKKVILNDVILSFQILNLNLHLREGFFHRFLRLYIRRRLECIQITFDFLDC